MADRAVRADRIIVSAPTLAFSAGVDKVQEPMGRETLGPELPIEAVDEGVIGRFPGSREVEYGGGRWGYRKGNAQSYDSMLHDGLNDAFSGEHSGWHTEDLVAKYQISRETHLNRINSSYYIHLPIAGTSGLLV